MKTFNFILLGFIITFFSCKKMEITPGNYQLKTEPIDTTNWQSQYGNGGSVPNGNWGNNSNNNQLVGTNWVITNLYYNFVNLPKSDTLRFVSNTKYLYNSSAVQYSYVLYSTLGNSTIDFYNFIPINGLYLSSNNFNANAFISTPIGGTILLTLKDNFFNK